ncbi:23S rRNA (uracil(1939)-C(5))-methyltransferase RlmD [Olivibacter sp. SDN3]|uniref:23S rRNA (uracil(1939)-C(5))-methyltransferase RlmD n=1 Tax=Olivibacter sp. SDN3 TaxID=2764720 RepID=UPI001651993B|nr:23S rRNA (uracil(1939)-C(5))-methyltransferase RlmD [Olivibacter sp. SDN3]QNL51004.1 23S rRNA (uracil(1939)-C(5))-methyltransferase RlmD [Olivibacter sp. SDN3]
MRRKIPQEKRLIENIEIIDIAEEGKGVGKTDDLVLFIEKAVPGDVVDVELIRKRKNFAEARITKVKKPSKYRIDAFCNHFGTCGGCKWQHMDYGAQLHYKQQSVANALSRIGKIDTATMESILPSEKTSYYRNKLEYTFSNKRWLTAEDVARGQEHEMNALGFHVPLRFDKILAIDRCYLQQDPSNVIRNELAAFTLDNQISYYDLRSHEGALRNLIIRTATTGDLMVVVVFAYPTDDQVKLVMEFLKQRFPEISSLLYIINQKKNDTIFDQEIVVYAGKDHIFEEMEVDELGGQRLKFKIGAKSFYQTNSEQAYELYKITREFAGFKGDELVYDLYTGTGTIANFVAKQVKLVIGIEYVPSAIEDAKINAQLNGITNAQFFAGDMKDVLVSAFVEKHGKPNVVITDPPRAGMHPDVVERLLDLEAPKIVYVSCNAATQARDLALLTEKYEVKRIKPVDMFPHTQHVENVVLLELK